MFLWGFWTIQTTKILCFSKLLNSLESIMSFDFQSSNMTDREAQAYQKKTFKRGRGKRSQRNKLPPTSCDPETTPPSTEMDPAEDKENMMNLEILGKTYSFVKNSYVCVKRSHPFITKLGNLAEVSHRWKIVNRLTLLDVYLTTDCSNFCPLDNGK